MKLLLIASDKATSDSLHFLMDSQFDLEIQEIPSAEQAVWVLEKETRVQLIMGPYATCKSHLPSLLPFLLKRRPGAACFLWSADASPDLSFLEAPLKDLVRLIHLKSAAENLYQAVAPYVPLRKFGSPDQKNEFCRIKTPLLVATSPLSRDIFIALPSGRYLKLFREGDVFDRQDLARYYLQKKVEYLHLRAADATVFLEKITRLLIELAEIQEKSASHGPPAPAPVPASAPNKPVEILQKEFDSHPWTAAETVHSLTQSLGFTPEVQELTRAAARHAVAALQSKPTLAEFLGKLTREAGKYIPVHSMLVGQVACLLANEMDWRSEQTFTKLVLAGMLHDVTLSNHALAAIESLEELEKRKAEFTDEEIAAFRDHPIKSGEIAKNFPEIPPDVDTILSEHHERPDGTGFPRGLSHSRVGPLSALFIVAHDFVDHAMRQPEGTPVTVQQLQQFCADRTSLYSLGNFKKVLRVVPNLAQH